MSTQRNYRTDLTDRQWELIEPSLPAPKSGPGKPGRPACDLGTVVNGILYVNKAGCQWRMLAKDFGRWNTVYVYFNRWNRTGIWKRLMERLGSQERQRQGHAAQPFGWLWWTAKVSRPPRKGKPSGLMAANTSRDASVICWLTPWDCC